MDTGSALILARRCRSRASPMNGERARGDPSRQMSDDIGMIRLPASDGPPIPLSVSMTKGRMALLPLYAGRVDCIFIDPPYNTGNEGWCYNDNVKAPMIREWLDYNPVGIEDGLRHDKWCARECIDMGLPLNAWCRRRLRLRSTSQSLLRHRPDQDQPPHPPSFTHSSKDVTSLCTTR